MINNDKEIWGILTSVLEGNPTDEEMLIFETWINENEGNRQFFDTLLLAPNSPEKLTDDAKKRIFSKIKVHIRSTSANRTLQLWKYSTVASVALFIVTALYVVNSWRTNDAPVNYIEARTPYGVISKIILPDSSVVFLNAGSYLKYPANFKKDIRYVELKGEGYFEVKKDAERQFVVSTEKLDIRVFGTSFDVKSFEDEDIFETTLIEGSIGILNKSGKTELIKLYPDQRLTYDTESGKIVLNKVDAILAASWARGKYYFEKETLPVIIKKLERSFNIPMLITSNDLNTAKFSGLFDKNKTVFQILDIMKMHGRFNYKYSKDTIYIYK